MAAAARLTLHLWLQQPDNVPAHATNASCQCQRLPFPRLHMQATASTLMQRQQHGMSPCPCNSHHPCAPPPQPSLLLTEVHVCYWAQDGGHIERPLRLQRQRQRKWWSGQQLCGMPMCCGCCSKVVGAGRDRQAVQCGLSGCWVLCQPGSNCTVTTAPAGQAASSHTAPCTLLQWPLHATAALLASGTRGAIQKHCCISQHTRARTGPMACVCCAQDTKHCAPRSCIAESSRGGNCLDEQSAPRGLAAQQQLPHTHTRTHLELEADWDSEGQASCSTGNSTNSTSTHVYTTVSAN
jgi:hypothetical protein